MKDMKKISILAIAATMAFTSCSDMDEMLPEGGTLTEDQVKETNNAIPERVSADLAGLYTSMCSKYTGLPNSGRDDDFGFPTEAISNDLNGADMICDNNGYNWFSPASDYSDRYANYANPYIRFVIFYNQIKRCNDIIISIGENPEDATLKSTLGQALAVRAFDYLNLASHFQFNYQIAGEKPCVPIVTEEQIDFSNNPRASVKQVYDLILSDLNSAIELLEGFARPNKNQIDQQVAYGLRARAYLAMGEWEKAAEDAKKAVAGYTPYTLAEVSVPAFCDINDHNWMWGYFAEADYWNMSLASSASQLASFSGNAYTSATGMYKRINTLLWEKIPASDIRKQWWVDEGLKSSLLNTISWNGHSGVELATYEYEDKVAFLPFTNVKFGVKNGPGSQTNDNDWCYMRAEEMILIQAEAIAMSGKLEEGKQILTNFVKTNRDPSYSCSSISDVQKFQDEVWKQRRIELWGEGFWVYDQMRLHKPVVRIHGSNIYNWPDAFAFNIAADDGYLLMRFCNDEMDTNSAIVDNEEGSQPQPMQNADLLDGVTD